MKTFLQLFLLVDVFFMGVIASAAVRHAYAHFRPHDHEPEKDKPHTPIAQTGHLPPSVKEKMVEEAQKNFQSILDQSYTELQKDLEATAVEIKQLLEKQGTETLGKELERYQARIAELQQQTETDVAERKTRVDETEAQLRAKLTEDIEAEKQRLLQQLDTKLADAVGSFLTDTLQHNIDLGAQTAYLTAMLEEHKDELAKEVRGEA